MDEETAMASETDQQPRRWSWRVGSLGGIVLENDRLVGLLDPEHVGAMLAIRSDAPRGLA
jgi:hypothetical protein